MSSSFPAHGDELLACLIVAVLGFRAVAIDADEPHAGQAAVFDSLDGGLDSEKDEHLVHVGILATGG